MQILPLQVHSNTKRMTPEVTHLHLLRGTPFFTALTTQQLQWVIRHSQEWGASDGIVVTSSHAVEESQNCFWILLDGHWRLDIAGKGHSSGNADAGKWFNADYISSEFQLVITDRSYVMRIERNEMDAMLANGFGFQSHLESGNIYYKTLK